MYCLDIPVPSTGEPRQGSPLWFPWAASACPLLPPYERALGKPARKAATIDASTKCTKPSLGGTFPPSAATPARRPHHPSSVAARQTIQPSLPPLHLTFDQQLLGRVGNSSFHTKAAVIVNSLPLVGRVACLSRPRNTPSPSCPLFTPKPSRTLSTPPPPALACRGSDQRRLPRLPTTQPPLAILARAVVALHPGSNLTAL